MILIADDPIIRCIERTGYPPWLQGRWDDDEEHEFEEEDNGNRETDY